jgi:hypothetical protein
MAERRLVPRWFLTRTLELPILVSKRAGQIPNLYRYAVEPGTALVFSQDTPHEVGGGVQVEMQPTHNSRAHGHNPWKLHKVMSWFLKRLVTTLGSYISIYKVMSWFLKPLLSNATCTATTRGSRWGRATRRQGRLFIHL